jgi:hypothetical protein
VDALVSSLSVAGVTPLPPIQVRWPEKGEAVDSQPVLQWEQFSGAATYHVVVLDDVAYPPRVVLDRTVGEPLMAVDAPLPPGHYSWTVWAQDGAGAILAELTATFSVKDTIALVAPASGARVGPEPLLQWASFPGATTYEVVVIDDAAYPPVVVFEATTAETKATVTPALEPGNYSWRVLAQDGQGQEVAELNAAFVVTAKQ